MNGHFESGQLYTYNEIEIVIDLCASTWNVHASSCAYA